MKISADWLKDYVRVKVSTQDLAQKLTMAGLEVKSVERVSEFKDEVMEIEITSNRPDWLSHVGVAREISALTNGKLVLPPLGNKIKRVGKADLKIVIEDTDLCPYYTACLLEDVQFEESPDFIKNRLRAVGMRPINLIVDATNYVLLEMGQPLHAFDRDRLAAAKIVIRRAHEKEKIKAIDGSEYALDGQDLLITDSHHPIAVAGVMGGMESEVGEKTKNILLESAFFSPTAVRKTSRKLSLVSESSYRFERGVDPAGVDLARERAIHLIQKFASKVGRVSPVYRAGRLPSKKSEICFPLSEVRRILGLEISNDRIAKYLHSLGLGVRMKKQIFFVKVPSYRQDLRMPVDLVEEIARLHGYERIPESLPLLEPLLSTDGIPLRLGDKIRENLVGAGFNEVVTFSLVSEKVFGKVGFDLSQTTRIINPQNKELTLMRPTFVPSLLEVIQINFHHTVETGLKIFELANVYGAEDGKKLPSEELTLAVALAGSREGQWLEKGRKYSLFDLKGIFEEIFFSLGILNLEFVTAQNPFFSQAYFLSVQNQKLGILGKSSPAVQEYYDIESDVFFGEVSLEKLALLASFDRKFRPLPRYPASRRDMAIVLAEAVQANDVVHLIQSLQLGAVKKIRVIDLYQGGQIPFGKKSLAFSIEYRLEDRTLTTEEINQLHSKVVAAVVNTFHAELRA